ncbi:MAG: alpha/beta fold hydrolase [Planctomycetia bacterium]|nr:alpha/beta fold hydrolase [Planctomycetia bacterium]
MFTKINIPGATLNVYDIGAGTPILFVHGFPLDHTMWRFQIAELSKTFRCIAPDLRGFGQSTVTEGKVTMQQFADDLAALLDALNVTQPVVFCGLSMGGCIAWQFVRRHSLRLKGLILCDTRAVPDPPEVAANRLKMANDVVEQGPTIVANAMLPRLFAAETAQTQPALIDDLRQVILRTNPLGIAAAARGMAERADACPWLTSIAVPSLLIVGEQDVISTAAEMQTVANAIPGSQIAVLPNAGHMAPMENSAMTNAAMRSFLESLG